jgi:hypothetical protein
VSTATHSLPGTIFDEAGAIGWAVVYGFSIYQGFKDKSYGIPLGAICLNVTWEFFFAFTCPPGLGHEICFAGSDLRFVKLWAIFDVVILYQLLRFGRAQQENPMLKHPIGFYASIAALLVIGYFGQTTFIISHHDVSGDEMAWISNLIMNVLFLLAVFQNRGLDGLSVPAAWAKWVANSCIAIGLLAVDLEPFRHQYGFQFIYFLFAAVFVTDCGYVIALHWRRRHPDQFGSA